MKLWKRCLLTAATAAALAAGSVTAAFAGDWINYPDGSWAYEENGVFLTGWQFINGVWYYLDPSTGLWVEHPALTVDSVCYLLENAVNEAGWYKNDDYIMHYVVDSYDNRTITVSIKLETKPDEITGTLNTFIVNRSTRIAQSEQTKLNLQLD